jgi:hypothetical protein
MLETRDFGSIQFSVVLNLTRILHYSGVRDGRLCSASGNTPFGEALRSGRGVEPTGGGKRSDTQKIGEVNASVVST